MAKAKVIGSELLGMNNKIYKSGDVVTEDHFYPGHFDNLIKNKWLDPIPEEEEKPVEKVTLTDEDMANNPDLAENGLKAGDEIPVPEGFKKADPKGKSNGKQKKEEKPVETKDGAAS